MAEKPSPQPTPHPSNQPNKLTAEQSHAQAIQDGLGYLEQKARINLAGVYKKHGRNPSELVTDPLISASISELAKQEADERSRSYQRIQEAEKKAEDAVYDEKTKEEKVLRPGALAEALKTTLSDALRTGESVAVFMVDADHFKIANDKYGHIPTDDLLRSIAKSLRKVAKRGTDIIGRFGGEEFLIIMKGIKKEEVLIMANAMRENYAALQEMIATGQLDPKEMNLHQYPKLQEPQTMSIGASFLPANDPLRSQVKEKQLTVEELGIKLQKQADKSVYYSKETGRDRATLYDFEVPPPDLSNFENYKNWVDRYINARPENIPSDTTMSETEDIDMERRQFYEMYEVKDLNPNFAKELAVMAEDMYKPSRDPQVNPAAIAA